MRPTLAAARRKGRPSHAAPWHHEPALRVVGLLDLQSGATSELLLDADVHHFVPLVDARQVAVVHASQQGEISLIDADHPTREKATNLHGILEWNRIAAVPKPAQRYCS